VAWLSFESLTPLVAELGFGGVVGFVVGFALKKLLKLVLVLMGIAFAALQYLAYMGFITIHYEKIAEGFQSLVQGNLTLPTFLSTNIPFLATFLLGLGIGFKMG